MLRHCERSEAIQSGPDRPLDCFVAPLLAMTKVPRILIIAGSDSGGGAGIQADIKTVTMLGGHAMTAITALTAQNTLGVEAVMPVPADFVVKQIDAVLDDLGADAVKIGMIGSAATAEAVADRLEQLVGIPIVFDPVMVATSGALLADDETVAAFERLMRIAAVVTPNTPELAALTGIRIESLDQLSAAGRLLADRCGAPVLAKGGHLEGAAVQDLLFECNGRACTWEDSRIDTRHTHGSGCTLASAIATELGRGAVLRDAIDRARRYLRAAMRAAPGFGSGSGPMGHWAAGMEAEEDR